MKQSLSIRPSQLFLPLLFLLPHLLPAQQFQLQFNVNYLCPNGVTYLIHKCEKTLKGEMCSYLQYPEQERVNIRSQLDFQFKSCKVVSNVNASSQPAAPSSAGFQVNTPYQCPGGLVLTLFQCQTQGGQDLCYVNAEMNGKFLLQVAKPRSEILQQLAPCKAGTPYNPGYLAEFPSVDRVIQGMKVLDPRSSGERVIGALYQLSQIVQTLAKPRALLPDEQKILAQYSAAQAAIVQYAAKALPGRQLSIDTNPYRFSPSDPRFGFEGIPVWIYFLSPSMQAQFAQIAGGNDPAYRSKLAAEQQAAVKQLQADTAAAQAAAQPARQDPGSVAMRKCMESGRSDMECLGEGMKVGLVDLIGGNPLAAISPAQAPGLRISGRYAAGKFSVGFDQSSATFTCGTLIEQSLPYSIAASGSQVRITVPLAPKPLVLTYAADGKLSGPGPIAVDGRVVAGGTVATTSTSYQAESQTTTQTQQIDAAQAQNYAGTDAVHQNGSEYTVDTPVSSTTYTATPVHSYVARTAPKTEQCNVTTLPPIGANISVSGALTQMLGTQASSASNAMPGLRLSGTYAAPGGLSIEFREDSATVSCGQAAVAEAYSVTPSGTQFAVKLQNGTTPFTLVLQANGTLAGSGAITVAGRKMIRSSGDDVHNFVPQNATCNLGTFAPQNAGKQ